jgi:uncharacterized membrane protein
MTLLETEAPQIEEQAEPAAPLNRMIIAVLALVGVVIAGYMLMYKLGVIAAVACGTGACETVQASPWSNFLGVPVPLIGVGGYATILGVALAGVQGSRVGDRRTAWALLLLTTLALVFSIYLSAVEAFWIGAWCRWCIGSAVVATLLFLCALPELPRLRGHARA